MRNLGLHASAIGPEECLTAMLGHHATGCGLKKVTPRKPTSIECANNDCVGDERTKRFHQIKRKRRPTT